jgi:hypothetical protein
MCPYVGQSVTDLFGPVAQAATAKAALKMTETAGRSMETLAKANTPIKTGKLRAAWHRTPAHPGGSEPDAYSTELSNDLDYAAYVEEGTGLYGPKHAKYEIRPKNPGGSLRWVGSDGKVHFAKVVHSPGSPGNYMLAIAMNVTEAALGSLVADDLEKWVHDVEQTASH